MMEIGLAELKSSRRMREPVTTTSSITSSSAISPSASSSCACAVPATSNRERHNGVPKRTPEPAKFNIEYLQSGSRCCRDCCHEAATTAQCSELLRFVTVLALRSAEPVRGLQGRSGAGPHPRQTRPEQLDLANELDGCCTATSGPPMARTCATTGAARQSRSARTRRAVSRSCAGEVIAGGKFQPDADVPRSRRGHECRPERPAVARTWPRQSDLPAAGLRPPPPDTVRRLRNCRRRPSSRFWCCGTTPTQSTGHSIQSIQPEL